MKVSALLLTLNEEANLPRCLDALAWCDDVVVVDSFSCDRTVEIARAAGARVVLRKFTNFAEQRNFALETVEFRHEWVLHLDADEVVTDALRSEITGLDGDSGFDAFQIAGKLMFDGKWLRHAGMYPVYQVRLARLGSFRFVQVGHGQREAAGFRIGTMTSGYEHFAFSKGLGDWWERHDRYSTDEAHAAFASGAITVKDFWSGDPVLRRRTAKALSYKLPFRPMLRFLYIYVLKLGVLDGSAGYRYAKLLAAYEAIIDRKIAALRRQGGSTSRRSQSIQSPASGESEASEK